MIVLDTNVLAEAMRLSPSPGVMDWLRSQRREDLYTTSVTQAEILTGIELMPQGKRRVGLLLAAEAMFQAEFARRILPFDSTSALLFPRIASVRRALGRPVAEFDAQIAAIAACRGASIATRNVRDFEGCGIPLVNPWA